MIERTSSQQLGLRLREFPAVVLLGPRQVGKTTLALQWAAACGCAIHVDLENPADLAPQVRHLARLPGPPARLNVLSSQLVTSVRPAIHEIFCSGNSVLLE